MEGDSVAWPAGVVSLPLARPPTESTELSLLSKYTGDEEFERGAVNEL